MLSKLSGQKKMRILLRDNARELIAQVMPIISLGIRSLKGGCIDFVFATRLLLLEQYFLVVLSAMY